MTGGQDDAAEYIDTSGGQRAGEIGPPIGDQDGSIDWLIARLTEIRKKWGNTTVTFSVQWGSNALWIEDAQKREIAKLRFCRELLGTAVDAWESCGSDVIYGNGRRPWLSTAWRDAAAKATQETER